MFLWFGYTDFRPLSHAIQGETAKLSPPAPAASARYPIFTWSFDWPGEEQIAWESPSNLVIYNDGSWFFYAARLANRRRSLARDNIGGHRTFLAVVTYLDADKRTIGASDYHFTGLDYKKDRRGISVSGVDEFVKTSEAEIRFATCVQRIR